MFISPQKAQAAGVSSLLNRVGDGMHPLIEYDDPINLAEKYSKSFTGRTELFLVNWGFSSLVTTKNSKWQTSDEQALLNILMDNSVTKAYADFIPEEIEILQTTLNKFKIKTLNLIGEAAEGLGYAATILRVKDLLTVFTGTKSRTDAYMEIVSYEEIYRPVPGSNSPQRNPH